MGQGSNAAPSPDAPSLPLRLGCHGAIRPIRQDKAALAPPAVGSRPRKKRKEKKSSVWSGRRVEKNFRQKLFQNLDFSVQPPSHTRIPPHLLPLPSLPIPPNNPFKNERSLFFDLLEEQLSSAKAPTFTSLIHTPPSQSAQWPSFLSLSTGSRSLPARSSSPPTPTSLPLYVHLSALFPCL